MTAMGLLGLIRSVLRRKGRRVEPDPATVEELRRLLSSFGREDPRAARLRELRRRVEEELGTGEAGDGP